jgi:hypothetical protein
LIQFAASLAVFSTVALLLPPTRRLDEARSWAHVGVEGPDTAGEERPERGQAA